jgi:hypothetical protein
MEVDLGRSDDVEKGSATVPVAPVGVPPTGSLARADGIKWWSVGRGNVFGGTPKTAGATPALPKTN